MTTEQTTEIVQSNAIESISRAEIDVAIATARRFPRQLSTVKKNMLSFATLDQETAESCFYTLPPRGGKNIQGPSVRLAEIAVSSYGNLRAGSRIIETVTTGDNPHVVIQAVAMDLENNISITIEKRRRITKKKSKDHIDEDDINLASNAGSAIAFRDAVFKIVPLALIKPVYEQAKKVAIGDAKTLGDRRARCVEAFAKMGIDKERLLARIARKSVEDISLEDVETLLGLHNAVKDGEVPLDDAFPPVVKKPKMDDLPPSPPDVETPRKKKESAPIPAPEPVVAETAAPAPEPTPAPEQPERSFEEIVDGQGEVEDVRFGQIRSGLEKNNILEAQCFAWLAKQKLLVEGKVGLSAIREDKVDKLIEQLSKGDVSPVVKGMKEMKV